jgi:hypothetical protein
VNPFFIFPPGKELFIFAAKTDARPRAALQQGFRLKVQASSYFSVYTTGFFRKELFTFAKNLGHGSTPEYLEISPFQAVSIFEAAIWQ